MVVNRACFPSSKLCCYEQGLCEDLKIAGTEELQLHHLYRAMDFLAANRRTIERAVCHRIADLLNVDVELIFYDTTSLHSEIDDEDESQDRTAADGRGDRVLCMHGKSNNGRVDATQFVVGLAVTHGGAGVPLKFSRQSGGCQRRRASEARLEGLASGPVRVPR